MRFFIYIFLFFSCNTAENTNTKEPWEDPLPPPQIDSAAREYKDTLIIADTMPVFPGGEKALSTYIKKNLVYPQEEKKKKFEGVCRLKFVIDTNGLIKNITVINGVPAGPECDKEAIRLVKNMPAWNPGKEDGHKVPVYYSLNVAFNL